MCGSDVDAPVVTNFAFAAKKNSIGVETVPTRVSLRGRREEQGANSTQKSKVSGRKERASLDGGGVEAGRAAVPAPHRPSPAGTLRLHGRRSVSIDPVPPCPPIWGKICLAAALISPIRSITALRVRQSCFPDLH